MTKRTATIGILAACAVVGLGLAASAKTARHHRPAKPAAAPSTLLNIASHLAENAQVSVDGGHEVTAPGYGQVAVPLTAGHHTLKVSSGDGVAYSASVDVKADDLFAFKGKSYWCVNLLEKDIQTYSKDECQEDVSDAG